MRQMFGQQQSPKQGDHPSTERIGKDKRRPKLLDHPDCPSDWSILHISLTHQSLSTNQHLAIIRLAQWVPRRDIHVTRSTALQEPPLTEAVPTEDRIERTAALLERVPHPALGVHICREELPLTAWRREQAVDRIDEILAVFPKDQIQIWTQGETH